MGTDDSLIDPRIPQHMIGPNYLPTFVPEFRDPRSWPEWVYTMRWYNGFSGPERMSVWYPQIIKQRKEGLFDYQQCCITGEYFRTKTEARRGLTLHTEDYADWLNPYPVEKKSVHYILHRRDRYPLPWLKLVADNYIHGAWFTMLTMDPATAKLPFMEIYPEGLPKFDQPHPELADKLGITKGDYMNGIIPKSLEKFKMREPFALQTSVLQELHGQFSRSGK